MYTQLVCMTQLRLDDPTDGSKIGVDFQKIYEQIVGLSESKKELIASENPCSKTPQAVVAEVRSFLKQNLPAMFEDSEVDVIKEPLIDDYCNVIEIACSVRDSAQDDQMEEADSEDYD